MNSNSLVRLKQIIAPGGPIPVSKSQWYYGVTIGIYPQRIKLGARISCWRWSDIEQLLEHGVEENRSIKDGSIHE